MFAALKILFLKMTDKPLHVILSLIYSCRQTKKSKGSPYLVEMNPCIENLSKSNAIELIVFIEKGV